LNEALYGCLRRRLWFFLLFGFSWLLCRLRLAFMVLLWGMLLHLLCLFLGMRLPLFRLLFLWRCGLSLLLILSLVRFLGGGRSGLLVEFGGLLKDRCLLLDVHSLGEHGLGRESLLLHHRLRRLHLHWLLNHLSRHLLRHILRLLVLALVDLTLTPADWHLLLCTDLTLHHLRLLNDLVDGLLNLLLHLWLVLSEHDGGLLSLLAHLRLHCTVEGLIELCVLHRIVSFL
jgi:hypothetical protein